MKKMYIAPEMEILDTEIEGGILAGSNRTPTYENGQGGPMNARQGGGFDDFDDFEEDEF